MKPTTLTFTILWASCALTYAGPERLAGKEMTRAIAPAPECANWTGFYIGGMAGYKFSHTDITLDLSGLWNGSGGRDPFDRNVLEPRGSEDLIITGFEAGGVVGYNYQWNKLVVGLEAAGGYLWLDDSHETEIFGVPNSPSTYSIRTSLETHYLVTVGPRIGYALCRWLPYVTGGLAVGDVDFDQQFTEHDQVFSEGGSKSETRLGWMAGGGLQFAITDHWSARGQYQYIDLGCVKFHHVGSAPYQGYFGDSEACLPVHNASFALLYKF